MSGSTRRNSFSTLRRFARQAQKSRVHHRCELCSVALPAQHQHLLDLSSRTLVCGCQPCTMLFSEQTEKYRPIPRQTFSLPGFQMSDAEWESFAIPISLAFLYYDSKAEKMVAMYPSPAGATESLLSLQTWETLVANNPILQEMIPDVQALLVNRFRGETLYYLVPIDECFRLVGLIRIHWRGLSGGSEVWQEIEQFFSALNKKARPATEMHRA
ncbi:MAG: DUF5947 family protein [Anaerolineae bacterium]|nr:DUF5947 family protein [Anaerolineae bacterium]